MSVHDYAQAISGSKMKPSKKAPMLRSVEIEKGAEGGHIVTHRFTSGDGPYQEPKPFPFGADEGEKLMAHLKEHMGIKMGKGTSEEKETEE